MNTDEYINTLTEQIRCKKARHAVAEEIRAHIEDQKQEYLCEGADEAEAEEMAVKEMGDPIEAGVALDTIHRPKMAWGMIAECIKYSRPCSAVSCTSGFIKASG